MPAPLHPAPASRSVSIAGAASLFAALSILGVACKAPTTPAGQGPTAAPEESPSTDAPIGPILQQSGDISLHALQGSPTYQDASLTLVAPTTATVSGDAAFAFKVENFQLQAQSSPIIDDALASSDKGQHIHLVLNDQPYMAHYEDAFEVPLEPGRYRAVAFLSRSHHESVKSPGAFAVTQFVVGDDASDAFDLAAPQIVYSRPKGTYAGADADAVLLDFYALNAPLAEDAYGVVVSVAGEQFTLRSWEPVLMTGLPEGQVEVRLQLVDRDGEPVPGPFNDVTRTITVERKPNP
ncbi:MAG: hypothetical protein AAGA54_12325 [Myxococcota bacterium]